MNNVTFAHFCFSCGYKGNLESLLRDLTGEVPGELRQELQTQSFIAKAKLFRDDPDEVPAGESLPVLTEWSLANILRRVPRRMRELRKLTPEALDHYEVRWDTESRQWVLPIRDRWGIVIGGAVPAEGIGAHPASRTQEVGVALRYHTGGTVRPGRSGGVTAGCRAAVAVQHPGGVTRSVPTSPVSR